MQVLVDTSVWSLALRRPVAGVNDDEPREVALLRDLIGDGRAVMMGAIRQELLSGIRSAPQFDALRDALSGFDDLPLERADYERAAEFFNQCRSRGVQGSNTDFLICAAAAGRRLPILTTDRDFTLFKPHLPIELMG